MKALATKDNSSTSEVAKSGNKNNRQTDVPAVQAELNPVWHRMATGVAHHGGSSSMSGSDSGKPALQTKPAVANSGPVLVQRMCAECEQELEKDTGSVQRKPAFAAASDPEEPEQDSVQLKLVQPQTQMRNVVQRLCTECEEEQQTATTAVQPQLTIGAVDDPYEREADRVADQVVQRSKNPSATIAQDLAISRNNSSVNLLQAKCNACAAQDQLIPQIQAKSRTTKGNGAGNLNHVSHVIANPTGGREVSSNIRSLSEPVLDADLSGVRVYSDAGANQAADDLKARAFTHGNGIYLGSGQSANDLGLMAHELTHTVQQGASPALQRAPLERHNAAQDELASRRNSSVPEIQKIDWPDIDIPTPGDAWDAAESAYDDVSDAVGDAYDSASEAVGDAYDTVSEAADDAYDSVSEAAGDAYDAASEAVEDAVDWMASEAGRLAKRIVGAFGGRIRITTAGIEVTLPQRCLDPLHLKHRFDEMNADTSVPVFALPIAPGVTITGEIGVAGAIAPELQIQLGPLCLNAITILLNPFTASASIRGGVSMTSAVSLAGEVRAGLTAQLGLTALVPVPPVIVPITVPVAGLEGGIAGMVRGIAAQTKTISGSLSLSGTTINIGSGLDMDLGLGADMFLGAYGQLSLLGQHICRVYWQPYEWHGGIAASLGLSGGLSIIPGLPTIVTPRLNPPTLGSLPFNQIPLVIDRSGFSDNCPIKDKICNFMDLFNLYPSRRGGAWDWAGTPGPGPRLPGPLDVYMKSPPIASGSECRGACGPNCDTCESKPEQRYTDLDRLEVCRYKNFQICKSHEGCRQHDAGFDWAADRHGEIGDWDIIMPWHMAANMECACNYPAGNCVAWIMGGRPHDSEMFFAESVICTPLAHPERFGFEVNEYGVPHILLDSIASSLGITRTEVEELYFERMTSIGIEYREFVIEYVDSNPDDVNLLDAHSIMAYTTNIFVKQLNKKMREGTDTIDDQPLISNINNALDELPDQSGTFYRALGSVPDDFDSRYAVGNVVTEASYLSVSEELNPNYRSERVLVITSDHVKDISELSMDVNFGDIIGHDPVDSEHIISPGRRFRITRKEGKYVYLQEI